MGKIEPQKTRLKKKNNPRRKLYQAPEAVASTTNNGTSVYGGKISPQKEE